MSTVLSVSRLLATLSALAPIDAISVPSIGTLVGVRLDFNVAATQVQKDAANSALASFDWSQVAQDAWTAANFATANPNAGPLLAAATQAIANNQTYLGIGNPTQQQAMAQVQALTQQMNKVIARLIEIS